MNVSKYGYKCAAGETFDTVAVSVYGDEKYASELLSVNPELCTTPVFAGGETLYLPIIEEAAENSDDRYAPDNAPWKVG